MVVCWFLFDKKRLVVVFYFHSYKQRQSLFPCGDGVHVFIVCVCMAVIVDDVCPCWLFSFAIPLLGFGLAVLASKGQLSPINTDQMITNQYKT